MLRDILMLAAICVGVPLLAVGCSFIVDKVDKKIKR